MAGKKKNGGSAGAASGAKAKRPIVQYAHTKAERLNNPHVGLVKPENDPDSGRKPCAPAARSHVNFSVFDSTWEATEAFALDHHARVAAWVKNDHLGFEVHYLFEGSVHKYRPDFLVKLDNGTHLVLETKGEETPKDRTKREAMVEWVTAVNEHGGFGRWACDVSFSPSDVQDVLVRHAAGRAA